MTTASLSNQNDHERTIMKPEVIVMLTHNDVTVPNAREVFRDSADLPATYWGFKDVGLSAEQMEALVADFKAAGKTPVLEIVNFDEAELVKAADLAIRCGFAYFTGSRFSEAVAEKMREAGITYLPFCGEVGGSPVVLGGTQDEIVADAVQATQGGADGVDLVAYRYQQGDAIDLANAVIDKLGREKVVVAGSINSVERMQRMHDIGVFAYTMGGALFEGAFVAGGTFRENLAAVLQLNDSLAGAAR